MWMKLLLASLFTVVGVAAPPVPKSEPRQPGPGFPWTVTCSGVLRYSTVSTSRGAVMAWSLEEGKDNRILRIGTAELKNKAEKLLGKKVKVEVTTCQLADVLGGHV